MAVAFDSVGPSSAGAGGAGVGSLSWTHTAVASGVAMVVGLGAGVDTTILSCTVGGNAATSLGKIHNGNSTFGFTQLFGIANVGSGAQSVSVTFTPSGTQDMVGGSQAYSGAAGTFAAAFGTAVTAEGNSASASVTVTGTTSGNMVAGVNTSGTGESGITAGTQRWLKNLNTNSGAGNGSGGDAAAGGSVALTWTITSDLWGAIAVEVKAAAAAAPGRSLIVPQAVRRAAFY